MRVLELDSSKSDKKTFTNETRYSRFENIDQSKVFKNAISASRSESDKDNP